MSDDRQTEGMGMLFRNSKQDARGKERVPKERMLPYKLASYEHDHEGKRLRSSKVVYSFWSAAKYTLILSLMLWWLPMFGQMIAGYVGGRRAGGPWRGVAASILPVVCLYAVVQGFNTGVLPSHIFGIAVAPAAVGAALTHNIPLISPYLQFSSEYVGAFVRGLAGASPYGINTYLLTVAFAYVGGVLAAQNRREIEYSSGAVMSSTTVLVQDAQGSSRQLAAPEPSRPRGAFAGISNLFHRAPHEEPMSIMYAHRRHRDPWASAADMRYEDEEPAIDEPYMLPSAEPFIAPDDYGAYRTRSRRNKQRDAWRPPQKRRGRPNMSSKPRFRYAQYENQDFSGKSYNYSTSGGWRRPKRAPQKLYVSTDPKSIRRAKKMIDSEWGRQKYPSYDEIAEEDETGGVEVDQIMRHHKKERGAAHNWDSI